MKYAVALGSAAIWVLSLSGCAVETSAAEADEETESAGTMESELTIPRWPGGNVAALSISIDDNMPNDHAFWARLGEETGARFTWFVITDRVGRTGGGTWAGFRGLSSAGHEIGSHSATVHDMRAPSGNTPCYGATLAGARVTSDYRVSVEAIRAGVGKAPSAIAYPCGTPHVAEARAAGFLFARNVNGAGVITASTTPLNLPSMTEGLVNVDTLVAQRTWGLTHFHTAGDRQQAQARALLRSSAQKKVWVAPVSTIGKYSQERHAAVVRTLESIPSRVVFELRDGLDDDVYDVPLEVELTVSSAWHDAEAVQRGVTLPTRVERSPTGTNVFVLVRPDAGPVVVGRTRRKES